MAKRNRGSRGTSTGRLRIVAGKWRSRLLPVADLPGLRPTSDRIRETLFNWLGPSIEGSRCLDLFAGSGALGFEALSRGAAAVTFIDNSPGVVEWLSNSARLLQTERAAIRCADAFSWLREAPQGDFDVIFLDPPFTDANYDELCRLIEDQGRLASAGKVYVETGAAASAPILPANWVSLKEKQAGNVRFMLYQRKS